MADGGQIQGLVGRRREQNALRQAVQAGRSGHGQVLVILGEAGVGKTALVDWSVAQSQQCRVLSATGVEAERELAFAGLHQLCAPLLDRADSLAAPQRAAIETAFGLSDGEPASRFLIGLAVLSLLAEAAEHEPVLCVVDDAQWLDRASKQVLAFIGRRLLAERVTLFIVAREPIDEDLTGLPTLQVSGLGYDDARALLARSAGPLDQRVLDRIVVETRGNPLALLELAKGLTGADMAGGFAPPEQRPLDRAIEDRFLGRIDSLPADTRRALLVAASEPLGDTSLFLRAMRRLEIPDNSHRPAVDDGLIELGERVRFRHPLIRSAIYRNAPDADRRAAHDALAHATDAQTDPDRHAWHRAQASAVPDEDVAMELERSAERARSRGGIAATAAFLERATELTPDPARRGSRALAAAHAKHEAGAADSAWTLLSTAGALPLDPIERALHARLRAELQFSRRRGVGAANMLLEAAEALSTLDPSLARDTYLAAIDAAFIAGRFDQSNTAEAVARAALESPSSHDPPRPVDLLLDGIVSRLTDGYSASVPLLRNALAALQSTEGHSSEFLDSLLWLACPVAPEPIAPELWDLDTWESLADEAVRHARSRGSLAVLPVALGYRATAHVCRGDFTAAESLISEADDLTAATGHDPLRYSSVLLAGWRGDEARLAALVSTTEDEASRRGEGRVLGLTRHAEAVLYNGLGDHGNALACAVQACEHEDLGFYGWSLVELVEAATKSGVASTGQAAATLLEERTTAVATDWAKGIQERSSALLTDGEEADHHFTESIRRLSDARLSAQVARTRLLYGEWLSDVGRRQEASDQLRATHAAFSDIGAEAFAGRAGRALALLGEKVRHRRAGEAVLTAQEDRIARLAAQGSTNPEIGAELFISPRTVEYHLRKVFTKLGVQSRRQLRDVLPL